MKQLLFKGKTAVFIDWANVYGWTKSLKREVDPKVLFEYLKGYPEIFDIRFYFGEDSHPKSVLFLQEVKEMGYTVISKSVKHIFIADVMGEKVYRRKCDFDMEICIDVHHLLNEGLEGFVFFTGDGDFEPLYKLLISLKKQVIVVYTQGYLGREIWSMRNGIFKVELENLVEI